MLRIRGDELFIKLCQVIEVNQCHGVVDVLAAGCIAVVLDILQVLSGICDALEVSIPLELDKLKISLYALFHVVISAEVAPDRCERSGGILLFGLEIDTLASPEGAALKSEVIVILGGERGLSPTALVDRLRDDRAVNLDAVLRRVFADVIRDLDHELTLGFRKVVQLA